MGAEPRKKRIDPTGPFAPPTPAEAEQSRGEPMAVAGDKANLHGESFVATTAPVDQMAEDVARRYRDPNLQRGSTSGGSATPHGKDVKNRHDENRRAESPEGYSEVDEHGFRKLEET